MSNPKPLPSIAVPKSTFPGKRGEHDFRLAPTLFLTFGVVVALLSVYEFALSGLLESYGKWENILSIAIGAVIAVVPTYIALRNQRILHRYALTSLNELREAEAVLSESERNFREMLENVELIAVIVDREGIVTFCNNYLLRLTGWRREEVHGKDWFAVFAPPSNGERKASFIENVNSGRLPVHLENQIQTKSGELREIAWSNTLLRDTTGRTIATASIGDDVTVRRRAERRLLIQYAVTVVLAEGLSVNETYQKILENLCKGLHWDLGGIWISDRSAKVLRCVEVWNVPSTEFRNFAAKMRQMTMAIGRGLPGCVWADGHAIWSADVTQDDRCERRLMAAEVSLHGWIGFPIVLPKQILGVVEFFNAKIQAPDKEMLDALTAIGLQIGQFIDRRNLDDRLRQAQKMEAIGTLSGGIAHDFNNILGAIIGYTELAKMDLGENPGIAEHLDDVLAGARRASELVKQILAFSRQQEQERKPIQLREVVGEAMKLLRATIPAPIEFVVSFEDELPTVLADATQIHQIVMNLGANASHAMKDRAGRITVNLSKIDVDADFVTAYPELQPGRYVRLSMSDTGHGMDQNTLNRIYEPFFTTKAPGEGTGLGLAAVQGIMHSHEGIITVYSHPGEGTTFHLYFPAYGVEETKSLEKTAGVPRGQGERILYLDDELILARMGKEILERLGYVVDIHSSAIEALDVVRAHPEAYDLVVTDQMMPSMTGVELARQLRAIRSDLPIILMTGYTATLTAERVRAMGIRNLLLKPISVAALGTAVHRSLSESNTGKTYAKNPTG
jgi:PAS domain S-box-containing protein